MRNLAEKTPSPSAIRSALLWLLKGRRGRASPFRGLISIQGFDRFCPYVPPSLVAGMRRGLRRDPAPTLEAFWRACGAEALRAAEARRSSSVSMRALVG